MPQATNLNVGRFDVAMDQPTLVGFGQGLADLLQDVNGPGRREWTVLLYQSLQIHSIQEFHHIVERAVPGYSEVVQLNGMRRPEICGSPGFAPKPFHQYVGLDLGYCG